jgi:hypothetical protein
MVISIKNINQKNHLSFMTNAILLVSVDILVKLNLLKNHDFL